MDQKKSFNVLFGYIPFEKFRNKLFVEYIPLSSSMQCSIVQTSGPIFIISFITFIKNSDFSKSSIAILTKYLPSLDTVIGQHIYENAVIGGIKEEANGLAIQIHNFFVKILT